MSDDPIARANEILAGLSKDYPPDIQWMIACVIIGEIITKYAGDQHWERSEAAKVTKNVIEWTCRIRSRHEERESAVESDSKVVPIA